MSKATQAMSRVNTKHGHNKKGQMSPTYKSWSMMKSRCTNPKVSNYRFLGTRLVLEANATETPDAVFVNGIEYGQLPKP